jgi:hypothetical protein
MRRTPLKRTRTRVAGRSRNPMPPSVAEAVTTRAAGACEACRFALGEKGHLHHRKLRSQGGKHTVENLIHVHDRCHVEIHARPELAYSLGLMVRSWLDPADVPVRTFGSTVWAVP